MLRAASVVRAGEFDDARVVDCVALDADDRNRRRVVLTGEGGTRCLLDLPQAAKDWLARGEETPKPGEITGEVRIIAAPAQALAAAAGAAGRAGLDTLILGDALQGEARELGTVMAGIARSAPASVASTRSDAPASGLAGSFVMPMTTAPAALIAAQVITISGVAPDWLSATTR